MIKGWKLGEIQLIVARANVGKSTYKPCSMGVGCDEYGVCYANAHGEPERCPREQTNAQK